MSLFSTMALATTVLGFFAAGCALLAVRSVPVAAGVLLEFLLAAGLLRLPETQSWRQIATVAVLVAVRRFLGAALARADTRRTGIRNPRRWGSSHRRSAAAPPPRPPR